MSAGNPSSGQQISNININPYKAQRLWPPDFSKMDAKDQFRLERRYRRRSKLAYSRPRWVKAVKLVQYGSVMGVLVYGVFFMDWGTMHTPFAGLRQWVKEKSSTIWIATTTQPPRPNLGRISTQSSNEQRHISKTRDI